MCGAVRRTGARAATLRRRVGEAVEEGDGDGGDAVGGQLPGEALDEGRIEGLVRGAVGEGALGRVEA
jgi:hypothetical protein